MWEWAKNTNSCQLQRKSWQNLHSKSCWKCFFYSWSNTEYLANSGPCAGAASTNSNFLSSSSTCCVVDCLSFSPRTLSERGFVIRKVLRRLYNRSAVKFKNSFISLIPWHWGMWAFQEPWWWIFILFSNVPEGGEFPIMSVQMCEWEMRVLHAGKKKKKKNALSFSTDVLFLG